MNVSLKRVPDLAPGDVVVYRSNRSYRLLRVATVGINEMSPHVPRYTVTFEGEPEHPRSFKGDEVAMVTDA